MNAPAMTKGAASAVRARRAVEHTEPAATISRHPGASGVASASPSAMSRARSGSTSSSSMRCHIAVLARQSPASEEPVIASVWMITRS